MYIYFLMCSYQYINKVYGVDKLKTNHGWHLKLKKRTFSMNFPLSTRGS